MDIKITESLQVNGEDVLFVQNDGTPITRAYAALATGSQPIVDNFSEMILGVANAEQLSQTQKDYIIDLLEDQLNFELQSAVLTMAG